MRLPAYFRRRITEVFGDAGAVWLEQLPALLTGCERRWSLTLQAPFALSYNYVAPATRADGSDVVIKAGVPNRELRTEIAALRHYDGRGAVELIDADPDRGLLLLERIKPGTPLVQLDDDESATAVAAEVMRELWRPPPSKDSFPTLADWARGFERLRNRFDGQTGPLPAKLVESAEDLFEALLNSSGEPVLLHGDLHHRNILRAERRPWLALDPKGVVGDPACEAWALLRNPMPELLGWSDLKRTLARRVDQIAERLGFDRQRVLGWGIAQTVLSAWWSIEDHNSGWEPAIAVAELLSALQG